MLANLPLAYAFSHIQTWVGAGGRAHWGEGDELRKRVLGRVRSTGGLLSGRRRVQVHLKCLTAQAAHRVGVTYQPHMQQLLTPWEEALPADDTRRPTHESAVKIHSLANLAAARATCRLAVAVRRSQACCGAQPTQDAGLHPRPRLRPAHGRLAARVRGRRSVVEDLGVRPPDGGQAAADDERVSVECAFAHEVAGAR